MWVTIYKSNKQWVTYKSNFTKMISIIIIVGVWQGLTRSNKCCPGPVRDGNGRKVLTRVGKSWHGPAWSNKGKYMLVRNIHSDSGWIVHVGKKYSFR